MPGSDYLFAQQSSERMAERLWQKIEKTAAHYSVLRLGRKKSVMTNNKYKVLLIEDDEKLRSVMTTLLGAAGYQVILAETCNLAITLFTSHLPDVSILDLGLPDMNGMRFLEFVRKSSLSPIIVLSARNNDTDKVLALDAGANDYVTKPFSSAELLARIRMVLRNFQHRANSGKLPNGTFRTKDLLIHYDARQVFVHGQEVSLSQTEYNIVAFLSEHCGKMMTYSAIIKEIWGYPDEGSTKRLQVNMANIRRKCGVKPGESWCISNELGVGYRMNGDNEE